ncbi:MAG: four helix bundle protein [Anaerolineales bacterium]
MARNFRSLLAWQHADALTLEVYQLTASSFPAEERFGLTSQLRGAAVSVPANIAEGAGRESDPDFRRFLVVAQGSLFEVEYYLYLARRLDYIDAVVYRRIEMMRAETGRTLQGLIRSSRRRRS